MLYEASHAAGSVAGIFKGLAIGWSTFAEESFNVGLDEETTKKRYDFVMSLMSSIEFETNNYAQAYANVADTMGQGWNTLSQKQMGVQVPYEKYEIHSVFSMEMGAERIVAAVKLGKTILEDFLKMTEQLQNLLADDHEFSIFTMEGVVDSASENLRHIGYLIMAMEKWV